MFHEKGVLKKFTKFIGNTFPVIVSSFNKIVGLRLKTKNSEICVSKLCKSILDVMNSSKAFTQIEVTEIGFNNFPRIIVNFLHVFPCIFTQNLVYYRNLAIFIRHAKRLNYNNNLVIAAKLQNDINKNTAFEKLTLHLLLK